MPHLTPNEENAYWNFNSDVFSLFFLALLLFNGNTNLCILVWKIAKQGENSRIQDPVKTTTLEAFGLIRMVAKIQLSQLMQDH